MRAEKPLAFSLQWLTCQRCGLCKDRSYVVLGVGNPNAEVMFVGEGPGPDEDKIGYPFIGRSGKLLTEFLEERLGWNREDLFIDNIVACFPHREEEGNAVIRKPSRQEIAACSSRIKEVIYRVDPLLIVALGATALYGLTGVNSAMKGVRGEMFFAKVPGFYKYVSYPVIPTYHPAALLRNPKVRPGSLVTDFWEDLKLARRIVDQLRRLYDGKGEW